jgi:glycosyltransferase involved in cell wall biosynthesis
LRLPSRSGGWPRTVLYLHPSAGGYGADRQLYLLATGLDPERYRPLVVLPELGQLGSQLQERGVEVHVADLAGLRRDLLRGRALLSTRSLAARNVRELGELARLRRVAIVHSNTSLVLCGQGVAERTGARHVQHIREIYEGLGGSLGRALWPLLRRRFARADALVCVSEAAGAQFGGLGHVLVVNDAVARELALPDRRQARRSLDLADDAFVVVVVGRISDWKGQAILLRALAEPELADVGAVAVLAGDAAPDQRHFERDLRALQGELGLGDRVRLVGFREDVETVLAAADAVAMPSVHPDALPNAVLEAAAAGLPVVATDLGGHPEIVRDGATGRLVPAGDSRALAKALRELADNPAHARALGEAAAADARDRFGRARLLEEIQECYDRVLGPSPPTAWLVPTKRLPVAQTVATDLRLRRFESWIRELGYEPTVLPPAKLRSAPRLLHRARRERPRLVLTSPAISAPALACIRRLRKSRPLIVADVMGLHSLELEQASRSSRTRPLVRRLWVRLESMLFRSADAVLAVNERHAALVRRRYRPGGVHTLRDAAEAGLVEIPPAGREALGIPADAVAVGFVGSLVYGRLEPLFDAWSELAAEERMCLLVVGDGPDLDLYRRRAEERGWLGRSVFFLGGLPRREALAALRACDVAYSDCWSEAGFPAKLFEYMALALPIVTEGKPQASEVLTDGDSALFYRTPPELARQIRGLANDPELRKRLGERARDTFLAEHTAERRENEFASLLDDCRQPTRQPRAERPPPNLVSVVMPVRNEEAHIEEQLAALAAQTYDRPWELILVDNGSTDTSIEITERWRDRLPSLRIVDASGRRGVSHARRRGAAEARGELIAFCDADDVAGPAWLERLVAASSGADIVAGLDDFETLNPPEVRAWRLGRSRGLLPLMYSFLPTVDGGNCAIWTGVAREIGWDESFRSGAADVEFSWRAQLAGYATATAPEALMMKRYRVTLRDLTRQWYGYGRAEPHLFRRFRRAGMPRTGLRATVGSWWHLLRNAPNLLRSGERRGSWLRVAALSFGRVVGSIRWRVLFVQAGRLPPRDARTVGSRASPAATNDPRRQPELVSVVMPVRNGEAHIEEQLAALAAQTYDRPWELVVVDNGSTDASIEITERWRDRLPTLRVVDASERAGLNHARNRGAAEAGGEFLAFCDADDVVEPEWLERLVEAGALADIVEGRADEATLNVPEVRAWRPSGPEIALRVRHSFLPSVDGGNCGMWTRVAREIGWDESFRYGSSDVEFAWRAQLAGHTLAHEPRAVLRKRYRTGLTATACQFYGYGKSEAQLYRRFRPAGMPWPGLRPPFRTWFWLLRASPDLVRSRERRGHWLRIAATAAGRFVGSVRWRVVYLDAHASRPTGPHLLEFGVRWPPETFISRKLERLAAAGFRVTVASIADSHGGRREPAGVECITVLRDWHRLRVYAGAVTSLFRLLVRSPRRLRAVASAAATPTIRPVDRHEAIARFGAYASVAALKPDIVHFEWTDMAANYLSVVDAIGCPFVVSCHGMDLQAEPYILRSRPKVRALPMVFGRAAAVHCVSEAIASEASRFGVEPAKVRVIKAAVDPWFFRPANGARHDASGFSLVAVGTLRWIKGFEYSVLAVAELARQGVPVSLDVLGGDPQWAEPSEADRLLAVASDLGLEDRVRLCGRLFPEAVRDRLQAADAYLQSSLSEGHPTAVVEAMACGLPVVATDCGGTREAVTHGIEGFLVPPRDWRAAADALLTLWHDAELRRRMGRAGRARVEAEFRLERQTERFVALYTEAVTGCS